MINHYDNESRLTAILRCVVDQTEDADMLQQLGPARTREEIFVSRALGKKPWAAIPPRSTLEMWLAFIAEDTAEPAPGSYTVRSCAESCVITYARRVKGATAIVPIFPPHDPYEIALAKLAGIIPVGYGVQGRPWELLINQLAGLGPRENVAVIYGSTPKREGDQITYTQDLHGYDHPWPGGGGKNLFGFPSRTTVSNGITYTINDDGSISVSGTATAQSNFHITALNGFSIPSGDFTFSISCSDQTAKAVYVFGNPTSSAGISYSEIATKDTPSQKTITSSGGATGYNILRFASGATVNGTVYIQIESGSTATAWTPYENLCPIMPGLSLILDNGNRLDVYDGEIDPQTGRLVSTMAMVDLGDLAWRYIDGYASFRSQSVTNSKPHGPDVPGNIITSNGLTPIGRMSAEAADYTLVLNCTSHTADSLYIKDPRYTDAAQFKAAMAGVQMVYELAEPITVQLTPAELQRALGCTKYLGVGAWKLCPGVVTVISAQLTTGEETDHYDIAPSTAEGWTFEISVDGQTATGAAGALSVEAGDHSITITATPAAGAAACYIQPTLYSEVAP